MPKFPQLHFHDESCESYLSTQTKINKEIRMCRDQKLKPSEWHSSETTIFFVIYICISRIILFISIGWKIKFILFILFSTYKLRQKKKFASLKRKFQRRFFKNYLVINSWNLASWNDDMVISWPLTLPERVSRGGGRAGAKFWRRVWRGEPVQRLLVGQRPQPGQHGQGQPRSGHPLILFKQCCGSRNIYFGSRIPGSEILNNGSHVEIFLVMQKQICRNH